jgi:8-oxo-dGTP pyrophosphatase MutT (NUDIX family)
MQTFVEALKQALVLDLPYPERIFLPGKRAAVLLLIGADEVGEPSLLMTQRTETVETHKGQMALPGGTVDPGEDVIQAALRETEEEVGISVPEIEVLGRLPELSTPTGFQITPVVGTLRNGTASVEMKISAHEIAEAFWIPLAVLRHPTTYRSEMLRVGAVNYPIHVYQVDRYRIWGATGSMIKNLLDRLAALG